MSVCGILETTKTPPAQRRRESSRTPSLAPASSGESGEGSWALVTYGVSTLTTEYRRRTLSWHANGVGSPPSILASNFRPGGSEALTVLKFLVPH